MENEVKISAVWLVGLGDHVEVRLEIEVGEGKRWFTAIRERKDSNFSHIAEASWIG